MSYEKDTKLFETLTKVSIKCKCSHTVVLSPRQEKIMCNWCGRYVYKNEKTEFKYNLLNQMKRAKEVKG